MIRLFWCNQPKNLIYLAAMSSSGSDDVIMCVCVSEVILFSLEHSKHLKQYVSEVYKECSNNVLRCFEGFKVFQKSFKGVPKSFQGNFKDD